MDEELFEAATSHMETDDEAILAARPLQRAVLKYKKKPMPRHERV